MFFITQIYLEALFLLALMIAELGFILPKEISSSDDATCVIGFISLALVPLVVLLGVLGISKQLKRRHYEK